MFPLPTPSSDAAVRQLVVAEALTWLKTPWHHQARIKGAGVDCAQFLVAVYLACGLIEEPAIDDYPRDWHLHRDEPRFVEILLQHCEPVDDPLPGDIAMFRYGRQPAHGSIVVDWPVIIHAWLDVGQVTFSNVSVSAALSERLAGFYRLKGLQ